MPASCTDPCLIPLHAGARRRRSRYWRWPLQLSRGEIMQGPWGQAFARQGVGQAQVACLCYMLALYCDPCLIPLPAGTQRRTYWWGWPAPLSRGGRGRGSLPSHAQLLVPRTMPIGIGSTLSSRYVLQTYPRILGSFPQANAANWKRKAEAQVRSAGDQQRTHACMQQPAS